MIKKFKIPIKIKLTKKNKKLKVPSKIKNLFIAIIITAFIVFAIDFGTFLFFNKEVLAYSPNNAILVTKKDVTNRLFQISKYTSTNLQQLINDVAIQQLVFTLSKKNKKFINKQQVIERLKKEGTTNPNNELIRSAQVILNIEQLLDKKPKPIADKDVKNFYKTNKEIAFKKKSFDEVKKDIKKYLEAQEKQKLIMEWVQEKLKNINLIYPQDKKSKTYHFGKGLSLIKTVLIPHLLTK